MALSNFPLADREIIRRALVASADGPFFQDWEFGALFGLERDEVRAVLLCWPPPDDAETANTAISNALNNLIGFPHHEEELAERMVGFPLSELRRVQSAWSG